MTQVTDYYVQIEERGQGREIIKLFEPVRVELLARLRTKMARLRELLDGRDLRPHYAEHAELVAEIKRLQMTADVMAGYKVCIDTGAVATTAL